jgi:hypothetical protein
MVRRPAGRARLDARVLASRALSRLRQLVPSQAISVLNSHSESHLLSKLLRSQMPDTCRERVFETCLICLVHITHQSCPVSILDLNCEHVRP